MSGDSASNSVTASANANANANACVAASKLARTTVLSSLVYVFHRGSEEDPSKLGEEVLLIHRDTRGAAIDFHAGKWNGLGGRALSGESLVDCARRELHEEWGFNVPSDRFSFLGFIQFPLFKPLKAEDWNVGVFTVEASRAEREAPLKACTEGTLHWIRADETRALPFWPGDAHFLPHVFAGAPFFGVIRYVDGAVASADVRRIEIRR